MNLAQPHPLAGVSPHDHAANPAASSSLMQRLKSSTAEAHDGAESHPFHRSLATGQATRETYAAYLGQLLHVHQALDGALAQAAASNAFIARVWKPEHHNVSNLMQDIGAMGVCPVHIKPMPAAAAFAAHIAAVAASTPVALLGYHYVMEGSKNGGKFISKVVQRSLGLQGNEGTRYMDPYGENQRAVWMNFRADVDACDIPAAEQEQIIEAAAEMFRTIARVGDDVLASMKR